MPTNKRKGRRGKQRKDNDATHRARKEAETVGSASWKLVRDLKRDGFRVEFKDDGHNKVKMVALHPLFYEGVEKEKLTNRGLWDDKVKGMIVDNYMFTFAQGIRDGEFEGTTVIEQNLFCPHLGSKLSEALFREDIHNAILDFLGQCHVRLSVALKGTVGERVTIPLSWMNILTRMVEYDECCHDTLLMVAQRLEPLVMCMIHETRQLFRSNENWHMCLESFFSLIFSVMYQAEESRMVMISYEGFLPFVAQASCWSVSRRDIVKEATWLQLGKSFSSACREAQRVICLVVEEHEDSEAEDDANASSSPLELIASTPLSNDPECSDSAMIGFVRSMRNDKEEIPSFLSVSFEILLLSGDHVDKSVIAELIDYGRNNSCVDTAEYIMGTVLGILGVNDEYEHIRPSDSRYAAAIRCGLLELCSHVCNLANRNKQELSIVPLMKPLFETLSSMAMHSKTSEVLPSGKRAQIYLALELDMLDKQMGNIVLSTLGSAEDVGISTCCNCLKNCEKKTLRFCENCKVEQYCSLSCQAESWKRGHRKFCNKMTKHYDYLRQQGVCEADIKRLTTLRSNLMVSGCSFVQSNMDEILEQSEGAAARYSKSTTFLIDFAKVPPGIEVQETVNNTGEWNFQFVSPVWYDFAARLGLDTVCLEKYIFIGNCSGSENI